MKRIATFATPEEAHLFRAFLGDRGIEAFMLNEYFVQIFWLYSNATGGVGLEVADEDVEEAAALYHEYMVALRAGPYPLEPVKAWPVVALLTLVLGVPLILFGREKR